MGEDGVEKFVSTPELHSDEAIELDPLPPGQVWGISPGGPETGASLYRLEVTVGKGKRSQNPECTGSTCISRECQIRRAEPVYTGQNSWSETAIRTLTSFRYSSVLWTMIEAELRSACWH